MSETLNEGPLTRAELYEMRDLRWEARGLGFVPPLDRDPGRRVALERRYLAFGSTEPPHRMRMDTEESDDE